MRGRRSRAGFPMWVVVATMLAVASACSTPAPPKPLAASGEWSRIALGRRAPEASAHVETMTRVKAKNGLWLALGTTSESPGARQKPGAWASSDDSNWQAIGLPIDPDEAGAAVAATSDGTTALIGGAVGTGRSAVPAIWTSADAWSWAGPSKLPLPADVHGATIRAISHGPGGWVAVGGASAGGDAGPLVWFSPDGGTWSLSDTGDLPRGHSGWSVAASAERYVAVVSANALDGRPRQSGVILLSSFDGKTWTKPKDVAGIENAFLSRSVVRVREWFVAAIDCCRSGQQHWLLVSKDGLSWQTGLTIGGLTEDVAVTTLSERQGRLVAWAGAGSDMWASETSDQQDLGDAGADPSQAWSSIDLPDPPRGTPYATALDGYGTGRLATAGIGVVLMRPTTTKAYFFWTFDEKWGTALSDVPPPARQWSESVRAMAATDVVVAVGQANYARLPGKTAHPPQGRVWVSSGPLLVWDEIVVSGNITDLRGIASDGHRFIAVGTKGDQPVVFASRTGRLWEEVTTQGDSLSSLLGDKTDTTGTTVPSEDDGAPIFDGELPTSIARFRDRFVVRTEAGHLWSSSDGGVWKRVSLPSSAEAGALCTSTDLAIASPYRSVDGETWTEDPTTARPSFLVAACAVAPTGDVLFVAADRTSLGVLHDQSVDLRSFDLGVAHGAAWNDRWLLLGSTTADPEGDPAAWESTDAREWHAREAPISLGREDGAGALSTALTWDHRLLLGGSHDDAALVLAGPAG